MSKLSVHINSQQSNAKHTNLSFHKRLETIHPPQKFNSILVHHVFMQENCKLIIHSPHIQVLVKRLLNLSLQVPEIKNQNTRITSKPTSSNQITSKHLGLSHKFSSLIQSHITDRGFKIRFPTATVAATSRLMCLHQGF